MNFNDATASKLAVTTLSGYSTAWPVQRHSVDHQGTSADTFLALSFSGNVTASREAVSYSYDANGNTTHDGRTGQNLSWNVLNLISGVSKTVSGTTTQLASYGWFADGTKYSAERSDGTSYVYKGNVIYEKAAGGALTLDCV